MSPQFVDFNADDIEDMVMGTFEGVAFVVPGAKDGYAPAERILDGRGRHVLLAQFWNRETEEWDETDRSPQGGSNPADHGISAVAFDWDDDGDLDLLLGAKEGRLYLQRNEGKPGAPAFTGVNERIDGIDVPGGLTTPRLVDWDSDGLTDLLCGSFEGGVYLYRNRGERGAPKFAEPVALIAPPRGDADVPEQPLRPEEGVYSEAVDYDGDGDLDLLVGGKSTWKRKGRELTADEEEEVVQLKRKIGALETRLYKLYETTPDDPAKTEAHAQVIAGLRRWIAASETQLDALEPQEQSAYFVWLYRRAGATRPVEAAAGVPTESAPVSAGMAASASSAAVGETITLTVRVRIAPGWHVYDAVADGRRIGTKLELTLPDGLVADGAWERPPTEPAAEEGLRVWKGDVEFHRRIRVERAPAADASIECTVAFQACDESKCLPPDVRRLSLDWRGEP